MRPALIAIMREMLLRARDSVIKLNEDLARRKSAKKGQSDRRPMMFAGRPGPGSRCWRDGRAQTRTSNRGNLSRSSRNRRRPGVLTAGRQTLSLEP